MLLKESFEINKYQQLSSEVQKSAISPAAPDPTGSELRAVARTSGPSFAMGAISNRSKSPGVKILGTLFVWSFPSFVASSSGRESSALARFARHVEKMR